MIKGCNNAVLKSAKIDEMYYTFIQRWKEVTYSKTSDSYQYKSINVISGIKELIHNINHYLCRDVPTSHLVEATNEELLGLVKNDYVMNCCFLSARNRLLYELGRKHDTEIKIRRLLNELTLQEKLLSTEYDKALIECINNEIGQKHDVEVCKLVEVFVSRCIDNGWSARVLFSKLDLTHNFEIEEFLNKIQSAPLQEYIVFWPFRLKFTPPEGKTREESKQYIIEQLNKFKVTVLDKNEIIRNYPEINDIFTSNEQYMKIECKAKDIDSASHKAIVKLSNVLNILSFFSAIDAWSIDRVKVIAYNKSKPYTTEINPAKTYGTYEYLDSSSMVYCRTERLLNTAENTDELYKRLLSTFSYANLSRNSLSVEEKYINMWIATESLVRLNTYDNIIDNVLDCIPNASCLRYIYRELRNFVEDCGRCELQLNFGDINILADDTNKEIVVSKMLMVFRDEKLYQTLRERSRVCNLLMLRCEKIHEIVSDEVHFATYILNHYRRMKWHLNRLYRIRNEIAHAAMHQDMIILRYTEHLYDYLATYISEVVRFATSREGLKFEEIITVINDNFYAFLDITEDKKNSDKKVSFGKLWTSGIMEFI